ncbi:MAG: hypothetical protein C5B50_00870 [Verrucomicrobia bacterium]|nr:MAG: hypothetical protein C5B50_00870 [Verrucomicrobiota bacterium]
MTITLYVSRHEGKPVLATELVESPDDGGWYLSQTDFVRGKNRTSVKVWPSTTSARAAWHVKAGCPGAVEWEPWYP